MSDPALALLNPTSGGERSGGLLERVGPTLSRRWPELVIHRTTGPGDAGRQAALWAGAGQQGPILVFGGDGTIHEVVNGLSQQEGTPPIGVIPSGTGNDFARNLGIPLSATLAAERLVVAERREVDLGAVWEGDGVAARRLAVFVNSMSVGVSPAANRRAQALRGWLPGRLRYSAGGIVALLSEPRRRYTVTTNGTGRYDGAPLNITIANGPRFGGGMRISPESIPWDGSLEQIIIGEMGTFRALLALARLYRGGHVGMAEVQVERGVESVEISGFGYSIPFEADGHDFVSDGPLAVRIIPGGLGVLL